jgi:pimeloyl-ACP methyl ester carboxylesterase
MSGDARSDPRAEDRALWAADRPENRSKPTQRTITLSLAIIPAASANPKPDPIVWLAGGPGDDAITEIPMALAGKLNGDRDVIFMSQRGI